MSKTFYNDNLTLSSILPTEIISEFTEIKDIINEEKLL